MPTNPFGASKQQTTSSPAQTAEVVGQHVACPYCGHPVPVLQHACIKVRLHRCGQWLTTLQEQITCPTCRHQVWEVWSEPKEPPPPTDDPIEWFFRWLGKNT